MTFDWRTADDETLEAHFNPRAAVGDEAVETWLGAYLAEAEAARDKWPGAYDIPYGSGPRETLDLHRPASGANGALFMFIHGGYWRRFSKADHSFAVGGFVERGVTVANVDYALCPDVTLDDIVAQMKACLAFVHARAGDWGCDPSRLFVGGHSAGAHLTAMLLGEPGLGGADRRRALHERHLRDAGRAPDFGERGREARRSDGGADERPCPSAGKARADDRLGRRRGARRMAGAERGLRRPGGGRRLRGRARRRCRAPTTSRCSSTP